VWLQHCQAFHLLVLLQGKGFVLVLKLVLMVWLCCLFFEHVQYAAVYEIVDACLRCTTN
jgi:hypothetical protein